jgi:AcrR family transcriptional regulator
MQHRIPKDERRRQIIESAATLFSRRGFRGTTTLEVAHAVGVSEATVFKHFATKEDLYTAIIEAKAQTRQVLDAVTPLAEARDDAALLRALAKEMILRTQADPTLMRLLFFSALEGHALADLFFQRRMQALDDFLAKYIADRIAAGAFRVADPILAAWNFIGMITQYLLLQELFRQKAPPDVSVEQAIEGMVATFLKGVQS